MAAPVGDAIAPAIMLGGGLWIQHAWWWGVPPSAAVVARFKAAHAPAAAAAGLTPEQVAEEAVLFDVPTVWKLSAPRSGGGTAQLPPKALWLAQACRLGVSALRPEDVHAVCAAAGALVRLSGMAQVSDSVAVSAALAPLSALDASAAALSGVLTFALNAPARCNTYVFCEPFDTVVVVRSGLNLDVARLNAAVRRAVPRPTPAQLCTSRSVCVWCGASPFAEGVTLYACPGCACVAYCSAACRKQDAQCEHARECGRTRPGRAPGSGSLVVAQHEVGITRAVTQCTKQFSARIPVLTTGVRCGGKPLTLTRQVGLDDEGSATMAIPLSYEVEADEERVATVAAAVTAATAHAAASATAPATAFARCALPTCAAPAPAGQRLQVCSACKRVAYCSPAHQREHWTQGHKQDCKQWRAAAA
jgi:hypothetical protein